MTRVLVAEDETLIRLDLKGLLEAAGFEVCAEARDGEEAVELARETEPDVALLDVKMPRLDGIEAARRILDERPIPIVMVTAYGERELVSRAVEAGVFGYLVKPFRETDLLPAIATATARHEELRALREEADSLAEALAARKAIERAKGILMQREGLSEEEAFARLRKASQISGRPLKVVAEALIATLGEEGRRLSTPTLIHPSRSPGSTSEADRARSHLAETDTPGVSTASTPGASERPRDLRREEPLLLVSPIEPAAEPGGERDERERGEDDQHAERDDALPGEDVQRLVDRTVDARRRGDRSAECARSHDGELDRRHARLGAEHVEARPRATEVRLEILEPGLELRARSGRPATRTRVARSRARSARGATGCGAERRRCSPAGPRP